MTEVAEPSAIESSPRALVARAGRYYRNARYIMVLVGVAMGAYFLYDGYVGYPKKNKQIEENDAALASMTDKSSPEWYQRQDLQTKLKTKHSDTDIALQKVLGFVVPLASLAFLVYVLRKSRGEIRLENDVLTAPDHPAVPLSAITSVDARLWKKKGIAVVHYDVGGTKGAITLDDFVYEQPPIDAMYDRIVAATASTNEATVAPPGA